MTSGLDGKSLSHYRSLIPDSEYVQSTRPLERGDRTRNLMNSGGFGRPAMAAPFAKPGPVAPLFQQPSYGGGGPMGYQPPPPMPQPRYMPPPSNSAQPGQYGMPSPDFSGFPGGMYARSPYEPPQQQSYSRSRHHQRHHRSRSRSHRSSSRSNKYGISDGESGYSTAESTAYPGLNTLQKKIVLKTIQDYCPQGGIQNVLYEDIMTQMEQLEKQGYKLPKGYDKRKHDLSDNEIRLYEQQLQRDRTKDHKKMSNLINFAALGLSWFCKFISVDWIKTRHLPDLIRTALNEGEFEESIEGIGQYMRGSVFDNPMFSTVLKFVEKIGEAHHREMEEEQEKLEEKEEHKEERSAANLQKLNKFRNPGASSVKSSASSNTTASSAPKLPFDVAPPDSKKKP